MANSSLLTPSPAGAAFSTRAQAFHTVCTRSGLGSPVASGQTRAGIYCSSCCASQRLTSDFLGVKMNAEGLVKRVRKEVPEFKEGEEELKEYQDDVKDVRSLYNMKKGGVRTLVIAVAIPLVAGIVDSIVNNPNSQWFKDLKKPWWMPPGPIFGLAWSILYPLMGLASWLVWVEGGIQKQAYPLALYAIQLVLNLAWPAFFFGAHNLPLALADITLLIAVLALTVSAFKPANDVAANLMLPYVAWVTFAAILNVNLWLKNRGGDGAAHIE